MNLKEIVNRDDRKPVSQNECLFVIKEYIKIRKGVDVDPRIETRLGRMKTILDLQLMSQMATHAIGWLKGNQHMI